MISAIVANDVGGSRNPLRIQARTLRLVGPIVDFLAGVMSRQKVRFWQMASRSNLFRDEPLAFDALSFPAQRS